MHRGALLWLLALLSLSRLVFAALFLLSASPAARVLLVALAGLSDFLDGWLARRYGLTTRWGALLDPVADRAFIVVAFATLVLEGAMTTLELFIVIMRDLFTAVAFLFAKSIPWLRTADFRARFPGKVVTVLQLATLIAILIVPPLAVWLVIAVGITSIWAIGDYTASVLRGQR